MAEAGDLRRAGGGDGGPGGRGLAQVVDSTLPTVDSNTPADGADLQSPFVSPTATFSEPMDPASVNADSISLRKVSVIPHVCGDPPPALSPLIDATVSYDAATDTATIDPTAPLGGGETTS